jgi:aminopeptidase N
VPEGYSTQRPHRIGIGGYDLVGTGDGVGGAIAGDEAVRLERSWFVETDIDGASTSVEEIIGKKRPALVLLNDEDLAYAKIRLDHVSIETAVRHVSMFTESLPRSMVLAAAWDMTRDAEMAPRAYVDLILKNVGAERESTIVLMLLRQLTTTLDLFVDPAVSKEASREAADALWTLAQAAAPGSDNQLQFVRAFAARAGTREQLDIVREILDDKRHLDGLAIDTDLAWDLLISLVTGGRADPKEIDALLTKDATASGERRATHARAAIPTFEAKKKAWDALINAPAGEDMPNALQTEATLGFNHVHDTTLIAPLIDDYFDMLRRVYDTKTNEMATNLIEGLYPAMHAGRVEDLQDRADLWLAANEDAHAALRRLVIEGRDGVRRALKAQERDREP